LRIVPAILGWGDPGAAFSAVIQIGSLAAVLTYFWRDVVRIAAALLIDLSQGKLASTRDSQLGWMIAVGTLPIVVCGLVFKDQIETTFRSLWIVSGALAGVGILLALAEWLVYLRQAAGRPDRDIGQVTWPDAIAIGLAQAAALVPGTSRSGATIFAGLCSGLTRESAARFSFLLSIPSILAAGLYQLAKSWDELLGSADQAGNLIVALLVTTAVGYATIPWLLAFLRNHSTWVFIVYRLLLAGVLVALLASGQIAPQ
jgi:undecaprenyl-diphosphatase